MIYLGFGALTFIILLFSAGSYGSFSIIVSALAIFGIAMIFLINYADFLVFPVVTMLLNKEIIVGKDYIIPSKQDCVLRYVNNIYYAIGYLTANIYNYVFTAEQVSEFDEERMLESVDKWENLVSNIDFSFRYNIIAIGEDVQKYREDIEGKIGFYEFQLNREMMSGNPNQQTIDELQRKINVMRARLERLSREERPVSAIMYIETIGYGVTEKSAIDDLNAKLNRLQVAFNIFDVSIARVVGRELYYLFNSDFVVYPKETLFSIFAKQA